MDTSGTLGTDMKFTGQRLDGTGLYYYGARYYDPTIGRFISPDSIIQAPDDSQSLNRYSYVINNPLRYADPTGNCWGPLRNLTGCGIVRNTVEKVKELTVDTGRAVVQAADAAAYAIDSLSSEAAKWVVGIDENITVQTQNGNTFTNVVAQESGLNIVNKALDFLNAEAVTIGGPFGVWSEDPLVLKEDIVHEGTHEERAEQVGGWFSWLRLYGVEYVEAAVLYGFDDAYKFHPEENLARAAAGEPTYYPSDDDYWFWP